MIKLHDFQKGEVTTKNLALYWEPGLGKTFSSLDRAAQYGDPRVLVVCQKSKVDDWIRDIKRFFPDAEEPCNLRKKGWEDCVNDNQFSVINYDLLYRRREALSKLTDYTLICDESSLIKHPTAQRTKAVQKLTPNHIILLSGTPCSGKYDELVTQANLLGWKISKDAFWNRYVRWINISIPGKWYPIQKVTGYRNVDNLKENLRKVGADFKMAKDCLDLPDQVFTEIQVEPSQDYRKFERTLVLEKQDGEVITGDTPLVKLLRLRQLCSSKNKAEALKDFIETVDGRLIVFYNFNEELRLLEEVTNGKPASFINGNRVDLKAYEEEENSVTFVQYAAGAYGHNLQKANKILFYSPPLSSEQYEQAKRRILRIGQVRNCFYWNFVTKGTVEEKIYQTLAEREDYNIKLFAKDYLS